MIPIRYQYGTHRIQAQRLHHGDYHIPLCPPLQDVGCEIGLGVSPYIHLIPNPPTYGTHRFGTLHLTHSTPREPDPQTWVSRSSHRFECPSSHKTSEWVNTPPLHHPSPNPAWPPAVKKHGKRDKDSRVLVGGFNGSSQSISLFLTSVFPSFLQ